MKNVYRPSVPPRRLFSNEAHHAAYLSLLDAEDRVQLAACADLEAAHDYAVWALKALDKVDFYLNGPRPVCYYGPVHLDPHSIFDRADQAREFAIRLKSDPRRTRKVEFRVERPVTFVLI